MSMIPTTLRRAAARLVRPILSAARLDYRPGQIRPWESDQKFQTLFQQIRHRTLVDRQRCYVLYQLLQQSAALGGALAEVGVYRGGTAYLMARTCPTAKIYLFDTFAGMPEVNPEVDRHRRGDLANTSIEEVRTFVGQEDRLTYCPGIFPASAVMVPEDERFGLVHVDCDIYESVRACCEWFYPRLLPGAAMILDDYGFESCPGAKLAVDEFCASLPEGPVLLPCGHAIITKLP